MEEKKNTLKYISYAIQIILFYVLSGAVNILPKYQGQLPILLISFALIVAVFETYNVSIIIGSVCGILVDISTGTVIGPYAIITCIIACLISVIFSGVIKRRITPAFFLCAIGVIIVIAVGFLFNYVFYGYDNNFSFYLSRYFPRTLYTIVTLPFLYLINFRLT